MGQWHLLLAGSPGKLPAPRERLWPWYRACPHMDFPSAFPSNFLVESKQEQGRVIRSNHWMLLIERVPTVEWGDLAPLKRTLVGHPHTLTLTLSQWFSNLDQIKTTWEFGETVKAQPQWPGPVFQARLQALTCGMLMPLLPSFQPGWPPSLGGSQLLRTRRKTHIFVSCVSRLINTVAVKSQIMCPYS